LSNVGLTSSTDRPFIYSRVQIWNGLPDNVVGEISNNGVQSFKSLVHCHLISTVAEVSRTSFKTYVNY